MTYYSRALFLGYTVATSLFLSGCGYELVKKQSADFTSVTPHAKEVTLSDVRTAYGESSVEVYDINRFPSEYPTTKPIMPTNVQYKLNKNIPVKDRSVEIYDIGLAPVVPQRRDVPVTPLSPPSGFKSDYDSPFYVIEEDGLLTDPDAGMQPSRTSVLVPYQETPEDEQSEFMTVF